MTDTIDRPTHGVTPAARTGAAGNDDGFDRQQEVSRLDQMLTDHRFAMEAIALALATIDRFDPARHRLTGKMSSFHALFKTVAPAEYMRCKNFKLAAQALSILIDERYPF